MLGDGLMFPNLFKPLYNTGNQEFHMSSGGSTLPKYLELYYRGNKVSLHEFGVIQCLQTGLNHHTTQGLPVWEFQKLPHSLDSPSASHSTLILHSFLLHILLQFYCVLLIRIALSIYSHSTNQSYNHAHSICYWSGSRVRQEVEYRMYKKHRIKY